MLCCPWGGTQAFKAKLGLLGQHQAQATHGCITLQLWPQGSFFLQHWVLAPAAGLSSPGVWLCLAMLPSPSPA